MPKIWFYIFKGVSKISGRSPNTLTRYPMFQISKMAHPMFSLFTFLKSLDLPQTPCEGIFHGHGPLGKRVTRTGVRNEIFHRPSTKMSSSSDLMLKRPKRDRPWDKWTFAWHWHWWLWGRIIQCCSQVKIIIEAQGQNLTAALKPCSMNSQRRFQALA